MLRSNGAQISPCILAKAGYALEGDKQPKNIKMCSLRYWRETVTKLGKSKGKTQAEIDNAIARFQEMMDLNR